MERSTVGVCEQQKYKYLGKSALFVHLEGHDSLVGLHLEEHVAGRDRIALFLVPLDYLALAHGRTQRRHLELQRSGVHVNRRHVHTAAAHSCQLEAAANR